MELLAFEGCLGTDLGLLFFRKRKIVRPRTKKNRTKSLRTKGVWLSSRCSLDAKILHPVDEPYDGHPMHEDWTATRLTIKRFSSHRRSNFDDFSPIQVEISSSFSNWSSCEESGVRQASPHSTSTHVHSPVLHFRLNGSGGYPPVS